MSTALATSSISSSDLVRLPAVPWRDPHTVSPDELQGHIARLEQACLDYPRSADLRTCLGMAHAMNFDVYRSMDALEAATTLDPTHFWAQMKYAELHYRLRALNQAERETQKALELATTSWQVAVARKQLQEVRRLARESARNVEWTRPLAMPALIMSTILVLLFVAELWR